MDDNSRWEIEPVWTHEEIVYAVDGRPRKGEYPKSFRAQKIMSEFQMSDTGLVTLLEFCFV